MVCSNQGICLFTFCLILITLDHGTEGSPVKPLPSAAFSRYSLAHPVMHHARTRRAITTTRHKEGIHHPEVIMSINIEGKVHIVDLRLKNDLVSVNFTMGYQEGNKTVFYKPTKEELDICEYSGIVRGVEGSWAALSTCQGVRGVIHDGEQMRYIEPAGGDMIDSPHYIYSHSDLNIDLDADYEEDLSTKEQRTAHRRKRYVSDWYYYQHSDELASLQQVFQTQRILELILIGDNRAVRANVFTDSRIGNIVHIADCLFSPLNINVRLVGAFSWYREDEMQVHSDPRKTLHNFADYKINYLGPDHYINHDAAVLITHNLLDNNRLGRTYRGKMCTQKSVAIVDDRYVEGLTANVLAHEIGHLLGFRHDEDTDCYSKLGIMARGIQKPNPRTYWSHCSLFKFEDFIDDGKDTCLGNEPTYL